MNASGKSWLGMRILAILMAVSLLLSGAAASAMAETDARIRNVILMITDGTSASVSTLSRWYKAYDRSEGDFDADVALNVDPLISGLIRTYWRTPEGDIGAITDSAPAATAYATGHKANNRYVGVDFEGNKRATVLELAKAQGKSTGLVATVYIQHATPAAFAAHTVDRGDYEDIAAQMVEADIDVVLGGGAHYLSPQNRADGRDLCGELRERGFDTLSTARELADYAGDRVWGMFADYQMHYDMDRAALAPAEPTLREMTQAALDILSRNDRGFFLMVEGSKVDWGAHNNDPAAIVSEFLAFDDAVEAAVAFARERGDTMVLILSDHGTGGLSIGSSQSNGIYSSTPLSAMIEPLSRAQITADGAIELLMRGRDAGEVLALYGIADPTAEELAAVNAFEPDMENPTDDCHGALGQMLSQRCMIGWTTDGHDGEDVLLYSYLPGDTRLNGVFENTDIAAVIEEAFGGSLDELTKRRFG